MFAQIQSRKDGDQSDDIAGYDIEQGQFRLTIPKESDGVQGERGEGGESAEESGEEECPCLGRKMKGLRHTPAEANEKRADHIDR